MKTKLEITLSLVVALLVVYATHHYISILTPPERNGKTITITVSSGVNFNQVANTLEKAGIIRDVKTFSFLARLKGAFTRIKAGEYLLSSSMGPLDIIDKLIKGDTRRYKITIPEGYSIPEIATLLADNGLVDKEGFISKVSDKAFVASKGINGETLEGYLFPDTYLFTRGLNLEDIIGAMLARFNEIYSPDIAKKAAGFGLSRHEVVTLASIIEKETGVPEERRYISAVFHNRLKKRMRLQSDPTVIYGIANFDGNLTKKHLLKRTAYNTYRVYGLPPGPIASPGRASIEAAVDPVNEDYIYFVSKNNGTHHFSKNLKEHNRAVYKYQKRKKR